MYELKNKTQLDDYLFFKVFGELMDLEVILPEKYSERLNDIRKQVRYLECDYQKELQNDNRKNT